MLGALRFDIIFRKIKGCQRPGGGMDGAAGVSEKYIRMAWDLPALGQEGGHNDCTRSTQLFAAEVGFSHVAPHGGSLLVTEGDGL